MKRTTILCAVILCILSFSAWLFLGKAADTYKRQSVPALQTLKADTNTLPDVKSYRFTSEEDKLEAEAAIVRNEQLPSRGGPRGYWAYVEVTAYWPYEIGCSGTGLAADGQPAIPYQTAAVDPKVIALGSLIYVPQLKAWFVGHDTGGAIRGRIIDLCLSNDAECDAWGRRVLQVYVVPPR